jgi:carbon-monoxide dehydrogenase medium subunit
MRDFEFLEPDSLPEACALLHGLGDRCRVIAGGSALVLALRQRILTPECLVSLGKLDALCNIEYDPAAGLRIGALVRHADIASSELVRRYSPMLADMAGRLANPQVRNQGTLGGNLCYADPATDPPGCLMALDARVHVSSVRGRREIPIDAFFVDYFTTALAADEIVTHICLPPLESNASGRYNRFLRTGAEHRPLVNVALIVQREKTVCVGARLVIGASTAIPMRAARAEALLIGTVLTMDLATEAAAAAARDAQPISDQRGDAEYRRSMIEVIARRTICEVFGLPSGGM